MGFASHEAAIERGGELISKTRPIAESLRAYRCEFCRMWHLTSSPVT
jgi:hypothetical protein